MLSFRWNMYAAAGAALAAALCGLAIFGQNLQAEVGSAVPFAPPSAAHPLGTDDIGQDLFREVLAGTGPSVLAGVIPALFATLLGTAVGACAGYWRGRFDALAMRLVDVVLVTPFLPLMILLAAVLGGSLRTVILVLAGLLWARIARVVRAQALSVRTLEYVLAARAVGAHGRSIVARHVIPAVLPVALAQFVSTVALAIVMYASLAFLGLADPTEKSWGAILYYAQTRSAFLTGAWLWWVLPPGLLISATVLSLFLLSFGLEPTLNRPQTRGRAREAREIPRGLGAGGP